MTRLSVDGFKRQAVITWMLGVSVLVVGADRASAVMLDQTWKLTASDTDEFDNVGWSVGVSGKYIVAGAPGDEPYPSSGSAYVFDAVTGQELHKLIPSYSIKQGIFGISIAVDGHTAVVGAPVFNYALPGTDIIDLDEPGSAFVFDVVSGQELFKLNPDDSSVDDSFGNRVAVSGDIAVITATGDAHAGEHSGSAYVFDITTGQQLLKLTAENASEGDCFGTSVAIDGDVAVIGATSDYSSATRTGTAYVFDLTTGAQLFELVTPGLEYRDYYGRSVAASDGIALVGVPKDWTADEPSYVSVFDTVTGELLRTLMAEDGGVGDSFGWTVAIEDGLAVVGAPGDRSDEEGYGSFYVFDVTTGEQLDKVTYPYFSEHDSFGFAVARDGGTTVVGATVNNGAGPAEGAVHVYRDIPEPLTITMVAIGLGLLTVRGRHADRAL